MSTGRRKIKSLKQVHASEELNSCRGADPSAIDYPGMRGIIGHCLCSRNEVTKITGEEARQAVAVVGAIYESALIRRKARGFYSYVSDWICR